MCWCINIFKLYIFYIFSLYLQSIIVYPEIQRGIYHTWFFSSISRSSIFNKTHLVTKSLYFVLIQSVLPVACFYGCGEALHLTVQYAHHVFKRPRLHLNLLTAPGQFCHFGLFAVQLKLQGGAYCAGQRSEGGGQRWRELPRGRPRG